MKQQYTTDNRIALLERELNEARLKAADRNEWQDVAMKVSQQRDLMERRLTELQKIAEELHKRAFFYQNQFSTDDEITAGAEAEARELHLALTNHTNWKEKNK